MAKQIVEHTCGRLLARTADGRYAPSADEEREIDHCSCGDELTDDYLRDARSWRRVRKDDDE